MGGGHPLYAAGLEQAAIAEVVFVAHTPFEHVGHGLEAAVRVRRETGDIVIRVLGIELVEHQERVEAFRGRAADHAGQADAGAIGGGVAGMQFEDITVAGHGNLLVRVWLDDSPLCSIYGCEFCVIPIELLDCFEKKKPPHQGGGSSSHSAICSLRASV
ncbi:Uncharacterised protein [Acinetobacter baumannii]|nr:Uncharacterised protein [Acinetobacter baumannii]